MSSDLIFHTAGGPASRPNRLMGHELAVFLLYSLSSFTRVVSKLKLIGNRSCVVHFYCFFFAVFQNTADRKIADTYAPFT